MRTIKWQEGKVVTIDQTKLPHETVFLEMEKVEEVTEAIKMMRMRGAPLLGAAAAFGLALVAYHSKNENKDELLEELMEAGEMLKETRPTAVNLFWAIDRILRKAKDFSGDAREMAERVVGEAQRIAEEDVEANHLMGRHGRELIEEGDTILTHCNAGGLATVEYGTALGVIRGAWEQGKKIEVVATETRPKLQGARLTTYELKRDGIPVTLATDNMVGYLMYNNLIDKVIVGADRVVQDAVINKIGTYSIAVLAKEHGIPFYVAAPKSTFDLNCTAAEVTIEERSPEEVLQVGVQRIAPDGVDVYNFAFDITPLKYVTAIICEDGVLEKENLANLEANL
ncbi:MAG: S-methyl-5-thioribose-1-phosphate isomerase [Thermoproteota archaeon]